jgi:hypothetical protein
MPGRNFRNKRRTWTGLRIRLDLQWFERCFAKMLYHQIGEKEREIITNGRLLICTRASRVNQRSYSAKDNLIDVSVSTMPYFEPKMFAATSASCDNPKHRPPLLGTRRSTKLFPPKKFDLSFQMHTLYGLNLYSTMIPKGYSFAANAGCNRIT